MRLVLLLLALVAVVLSTRPVHQAFIVSYPDETHPDIVSKAMDFVREAGGFITHEYKIFKGFSCKAPVKALETVKAWGSEHGAVVEEEQIIRAN